MAEYDQISDFANVMSHAMTKWMETNEGWSGELIVRVLMHLAGLSAREAPDDCREAVIEVAIEQFRTAVEGRARKTN